MSVSTGGDPAPRVAVLARQGKFLVAEPLFGAGARPVVSRDSRYDVGDLVLLGSGTGSRPPRRGGRVRVARRLGRPDVARDVIAALMLDRGLEAGFDAAVERFARTASEAHVAADGEGRRDLRGLATFTIDPVTARDYDDAISAEPLGDGDGDGDGADGWRVWVHIADVSAFVPARSAVDREAYRRGTSVYVPGAVEPMLPRSLSNGACSLVPGAVRAAVTVEMEIGVGGVRRASMYRSLIRSDERLTYEAVDEVFAGTRRAGDPWGAPLAAARAAASVLVALRAARSGRLALDSPEPEWEFDRCGHVVGVALSVATESHGLIEALMVAANEQVARVLSQADLPALYRVHEQPEPAAVQRMLDQLASLGVPTPPASDVLTMTPQQAGEVAGETSVLVSEWVAAHDGRGSRALSSLVLRSLKQARYDDRNRGHAGLASTGYCHFTSPIRRYPDLICHRALLSIVAGEPGLDRAWVHAAGPWCSGRERAAMVIERDADDVAGCFLLARTLAASGGGREAVFAGEVVGLIGAGAFIAFGEAGEYRGMLPVRRLGGDWWELNEQATMLVGTRNGATVRLGDTVEVRVGRIDAPRGRVDLLPASWDPS